MALEQSALQGQADVIGEEARKALGRARKILDMASRMPPADETPAERAAREAEQAVAVEKYQQVLLDYNLTQAMVDQTGPEAEGRREEARLKAGMYEWQKNLWEAVAELNFCLYWCTDTIVKQNYIRKHWDGSRSKEWRWRRAKEHEVIGRVVNTRATINLCTYIEAAIEKATREQLEVWLGIRPGEDGYAKKLNHNLYSRFACSFREGAADDVIQRVNTQRRDQLRREADEVKAARARAEEAQAAGVSDGTSLVIASYVKNERDLNLDHANGLEPGTTARQRAEAAARKVEEARRWTEWAAAHPEEAAAQAKAEREENARYWARRGNGGGPGSRGGSTGKERDTRAYRAGSSAGAKIGLDIQAGSSKSSGALS